MHNKLLKIIILLILLIIPLFSFGMSDVLQDSINLGNRKKGLYIQNTDNNNNITLTNIYTDNSNIYYDNFSGDFDNISLSSFALGYDAYDVDYSIDGYTMYITDYTDFYLHIYTTDIPFQPHNIHEIKKIYLYHLVGVDIDSDYIYIISYDGNFKKYDINNYTLISSTNIVNSEIITDIDVVSSDVIYVGVHHYSTIIKYQMDSFEFNSRIQLEEHQYSSTRRYYFSFKVFGQKIYIQQSNGVLSLYDGYNYAPPGPVYEQLTGTNTATFDSLDKLTAVEQLESDLHPYTEEYLYRGIGLSYDYGDGILQFTGMMGDEGFYVYSGDTFYKTVWGDYIDKSDIIFSGSQYLSGDIFYMDIDFILDSEEYTDVGVGYEKGERIVRFTSSVNYTEVSYIDVENYYDCNKENYSLTGVNLKGQFSITEGNIFSGNTIYQFYVEVPSTVVYSGETYSFSFSEIDDLRENIDTIFFEKDSNGLSGDVVLYCVGINEDGPKYYEIQRFTDVVLTGVNVFNLTNNASGLNCAGRYGLRLEKYGSFSSPYLSLGATFDYVFPDIIKTYYNCVTNNNSNEPGVECFFIGDNLFSLSCEPNSSCVQLYNYEFSSYMCVPNLEYKINPESLDDEDVNEYMESFLGEYKSCGYMDFGCHLENFYTFLKRSINFMFNLLRSVIPFDKVLEIFQSYLDMTIPTSPSTGGLTFSIPTIVSVDTHSEKTELTKDEAVLGFHPVDVNLQDMNSRYISVCDNGYCTIKNPDGVNLIHYNKNQKYRKALDYLVPVFSILFYYALVAAFVFLIIFLPFKFYFRLTGKFADSVNLDTATEVENISRPLNSNLFLFIKSIVKFGLYLSFVIGFLAFYLAYVPPVFQDFKYLVGNLIIYFVNDLFRFDGIDIRVLDAFLYASFVMFISVSFSDKYLNKYGRLS